METDSIYTGYMKKPPCDIIPINKSPPYKNPADKKQTKMCIQTKDNVVLLPFQRNY